LYARIIGNKTQTEFFEIGNDKTANFSGGPTKRYMLYLHVNLENDGYIVDVAYSGEAAWINSIRASLIILDVMMSGISGFTVAETIRKSNNPIPIIFLTAKNSENDLLTGFSLGGDDYLPKPFSVKELLARVKAILKRSNTQVNNVRKWIIDDLVIDAHFNRVTIHGEEISLTKKEFEILVLWLSRHLKCYAFRNSE
jgi:DNA-binding response OmpR family regulator